MSAAHKAPEFSIVVEASMDEPLDPTDPVQFSQLVRLHHRELLVYARALCRDEHTARDIVQDSFVVAYDKVRAFDVTRDFGAWMRGIVRNKWREWVRSNRFVELPDVELASIDRDVAHWQESHLKAVDWFSRPWPCASRFCLSVFVKPLMPFITARIGGTKPPSNWGWLPPLCGNGCSGPANF
ncbi:MAG: sigma factor [Verrucomicrobiales bacterium]